MRWPGTSNSIKVALVALCAFVGATSGIYFGYAMTYGNTGKGPRWRVENSSAPADWLAFKPGDAFPLESFHEPSGKQGSFEVLLKDRESVVLFLSWGCSPCLELLRATHTTLLKRLKPGVQIVAVTEREEGAIPYEYLGLLKDITAVSVDGSYWRATYHAVSWPTIVGVDNSGIVRHIQFGFDGYFDYELAEYFFSAVDSIQQKGGV
jgi:thiol-disulfide isomerase/thioredoxin